MRRYRLPISLKLSLVFVFCAILHSSAFAQFNFYKFSAGFGGGFTLPFADTKLANYSLASQITVDYYFTPYINTGLELQVGNMRGGKHSASHFNNSFALGYWNGRLQLGQFYDRYDKLNTITSLIRGLYVGMGVGIIRNNVIGYRLESTGLITLPGVNYDVIFPMNAGANVYIKDFYDIDRWELNFNFQFVAAMADKMDGDINPKSQFNDVYNYLSMGFRYKFGQVGLDKRKNRLH